jgi:hypothetical protein
MRKSEHIGKLAEALAKAQGAFQLAVKSEENPFFTAKYAPLSAVLDAYREPLSSNGLAVIQLMEMLEVPGNFPIPVLLTILTHSSGEYVIGEYPIKIKDQVDKEGKVTDKQSDPQAWGSAVTYARRYSFEAMICAASKDDDGEAGAGHESGKKPPVTTETKKAPPVETKSEKQPDKKETKGEVVVVCNDCCKDLSAAEKAWCERDDMLEKYSGNYYCMTCQRKIQK